MKTIKNRIQNRLLGVMLTLLAAGVLAGAVTINGQLIGALFEKLSSDPTGTEARVYYNTTSKAAKLYNGTSWLTIADSGSAVTNPMDSAGDMIYGGTAGVVTKLDNGSSNQVLHANGAAAPTWAGVASADITDGTIVDADVNASAAISGSKLQAAGSGNAGAVTTGTQTLAGDKTFTGNMVVPSIHSDSTSVAVGTTATTVFNFSGSAATSRFLISCEKSNDASEYGVFYAVYDTGTPRIIHTTLSIVAGWTATASGTNFQLARPAGARTIDCSYLKLN